MALVKRNFVQQPLFVSTVDLPAIKPHPHIDTVNQVLDAHHVDAFVETVCSRCYADTMRRTGLARGR